jgi:hypothetical protein
MPSAYRNAVIAFVSDIEAALQRSGDALRIVELAVALAARGEHALRLALGIDDGEQVVAGIDDSEAVGTEPGDATQLLRFKGELLADEIDRARLVAGNAPQLAAIALDPEHGAV